MIDPHKPIVGYPFAAPLSGKDTVEKGLVKLRPHIAVIHMSTLLQIVIQHNERYRRIQESGGLLPPEEAVKAFRRAFVDIVKKTKPHLPHIFANGACRKRCETDSNTSIVHNVGQNKYQQVGFRFLLDKEHILARAQKRVQEAIDAGQKPRPDDLGSTPFVRYQTFHEHLGPVLRAFEKKRGVIIDIDANKEPLEVLEQVVRVYDHVNIQASV